MKQGQDMRAVWAMLYAARIRHPVLVVRATVQLVRAGLQRVVLAGHSAENLLAELWPALEKSQVPGERLTPEQITLAGVYYRDMLRQQGKTR